MLGFAGAREKSILLANRHKFCVGIKMQYFSSHHSVFDSTRQAGIPAFGSTTLEDS